MALAPQASYSAGELDPALQERVTLQKYDSGLNVARNWIIGKTGRLITRPGRKHLVECKTDGRKVKIFPLSHAGSLLEWGHQYVRVYSVDGTLIGDHSHSFTEDDLDFLNFTIINFNYVMVFLSGSTPLLLGTFSGGGFETGFFALPNPLDSVTSTSGSGTGYAVEYVATAVVNGQETEVLAVGSDNLPINSGEQNSMTLRYLAADLPAGAIDIDTAVTEIRVYRRPDNGGAFGFIGSTTYSVSAGGGGFDRDFTFTDVGQAADFSNQPPTLNVTLRNRELSGPAALQSIAGTIYQQRLILPYQDKLEASRPGFPYNFYRDYPLNDGSSLSFRAGSEGYAAILNMIDHDGLAVFTSEGVFLHRGALTPSNLALDKKGDWVIDRKVPPISIPGGVLFMDQRTNTVRLLAWSEEYASYVGPELSVYSDHLFRSRQVQSWGFYDSEYPILWVAFTDGKFASFTYEREQRMQAWTRHDSYNDIEYVATTKAGVNQVTSELELGESIFVIKRGTKRYIELGLPRYLAAGELDSDPEADKWESMAAMDSVVSYRDLLLDALTDDDLTLAPIAKTFVDGDVTVGTDNIEITGHEFLTGDAVVLTTSGTLPTGLSLATTYYVIRIDDDNFKLAASADDADAGTPVDITAASGGGTHTVTGDYAGALTLSDTDDAILTDPGPGAVGTIFKWFNPVDRTEIELEVTATASDDSVTVRPTEEFPSTYATNPRLYVTVTTVSGLSHLEGLDVSVLVDGSVVASPYNNIENYPTVTVSSGSITLPNSMYGAIIHVGLPYVMDLQSLDIATAEQKPTLIESKTVNKVYIKTYQTRGLYIASRFPDNDLLEGSDVTGTAMVAMDGADAYDVNYEEEDPILGNRYQQPTSRRLEVSLTGDWKSNGKVAIRQVDPVHAEILSIIPDMEVEGR